MSKITVQMLAQMHLAPECWTCLIQHLSNSLLHCPYFWVFLLSKSRRSWVWTTNSNYLKTYWYINIINIVWPLLTYILGNVLTQLPNYPFESTTHFIATHIVPQIRTGQFKVFVQDVEKLHFGIGPLSTNGKVPPTSELALQDGEVVNLQGLLAYLICEGKDNYIFHLVFGWEDESLSKSYELSGSTTTPR